MEEMLFNYLSTQYKIIKVRKASNTSVRLTRSFKKMIKIGDKYYDLENKSIITNGIMLDLEITFGFTDQKIIDKWFANRFS